MALIAFRNRLNGLHGPATIELPNADGLRDAIKAQLFYTQKLEKQWQKLEFLIHRRAENNGDPEQYIYVLELMKKLASEGK